MLMMMIACYEMVSGITDFDEFFKLCRGVKFGLSPQEKDKD